MKVKEVIKLLEGAGWYMARMRGSHRQFKRPKKTGIAIVSGKLNSILKQAGLK
jgi:predicted RNA binding protein YcfA (HicA-like mRNA interferase family)